MTDLRKLAKDVGLEWARFEYDGTNQLADFAALLTNDKIAALIKERDRLRDHIHTCGPTCSKAGCMNQRLRDAAKGALVALGAVMHDCDDLDMVGSNEPGRDVGPWELSHAAITQLRAALGEGK